MGKTYWKNVVLPCIMVTNSVVEWQRSELEKLQRLENSVWRQVLGAPSYVALESLRGEIGCATFEERDMRNKLNYVHYMGNSGIGLLQKVFEIRLKDGKDP